MKRESRSDGLLEGRPQDVHRVSSVARQLRVLAEKTKAPGVTQQVHDLVPHEHLEEVIGCVLGAHSAASGRTRAK